MLSRFFCAETISGLLEALPSLSAEQQKNELKLTFLYKEIPLPLDVFLAITRVLFTPLLLVVGCNTN
jgi:hypothetical protein